MIMENNFSFKFGNAITLLWMVSHAWLLQLPQPRSIAVIILLNRKTQRNSKNSSLNYQSFSTFLCSWWTLFSLAAIKIASPRVKSKWLEMWMFLPQKISRWSKSRNFQKNLESLWMISWCVPRVRHSRSISESEEISLET
jgi:hypothetical protein